MKIKTFEEWVAAVEREHLRLSAVKDYLNADGMDRLKTFRTFSEISCFASTASDMLAETKANVNDFTSHHAIAPIHALERIVNQEKSEVGQHSGKE